MAKVKIYDKEISCKSVYRNIKYPRLEFKGGKLFLILPKGYKGGKELVRKHQNWIYKKASLIERSFQIAENLRLTSDASLERFKIKVGKIIQSLSKELRVKVNKVFFRKMRSKWGSCNSKGNLTINSYLRFLPRTFIEYVLFHEMAHRICRRHNGGFYKIIKKRFENSDEMEEKLFAYGLLVKNIETRLQ